MRIRSLLAGLSLATATLVGLAEPVHATAKPKLDLYGRGTWTTDGAGATVTGNSDGNPVAGATPGWIGPDDGTNPPWSGCEPGSG